MKVIFKASHSGKLKLAYTSPNIDCKTVRILRIQVRASSQTKGLERGGRVRLARFARVRL